ncbi:hypothetical protein DMN91_004182 [Ooceraea biroi]|uniref:Ig-like domain-containing protein n=1 Tax=Ooceraea biroi TaxID=2015173 RepID=A0A3L8DUA1_OOCBI|nr:hypothetical protein DMN91_004182 [Ooceraea biroi]
MQDQKCFVLSESLESFCVLLTRIADESIRTRIKPLPRFLAPSNIGFKAKRWGHSPALNATRKESIACEVKASKIVCVRFMLQVSWMRKRDMHILSAGISMYTSDLRFQVIHPDKSENWTLQIKSPQERDSGVYECQVSTEPKMSLNYSLNVIEPQRQPLMFCARPRKGINEGAKGGKASTKHEGEERKSTDLFDKRLAGNTSTKRVSFNLLPRLFSPFYALRAHRCRCIYSVWSVYAPGQEGESV